MFQISTDAATICGVLFRTGRTFGLYGQSNEGVDTPAPTPAWIAPDIRAPGRGLGNAQDSPFRFRNFLPDAPHLELIRHAELENEFGMAATAPFLPLFRVPQGALLNTLSGDGDRVAEYDHGGL